MPPLQGYRLQGKSTTPQDSLNPFGDSHKPKGLKWSLWCLHIAFWEWETSQVKLGYQCIWEAAVLHSVYMFRVSGNLVSRNKRFHMGPAKPSRHWETGWKIGASTWPPGVGLRRGPAAAAAAAAAKSLQSCLTLCDPTDGSPWGSLGFSSQEHWSGLPFPSPMHESEKWKWSRSVVPDSSRPHGLQPTRLLCPRDFPGKSTGVGCHCLLRRRGSSQYQREYKESQMKSTYTMSLTKPKSIFLQICINIHHRLHASYENL